MSRIEVSRLRWGLAALAALVVAGAWLGGCTNDAFDPTTVWNQPPTAKIYVAADDLNSTSYYERTLAWSGSDVDGFVEEYHVSIETHPDTIRWTVTTSTDTTMTFATDDEGRAYALLRVACRDNYGAMSDTVSQYIPLQNFPPVVNPQHDFDPAPWSYGSAIFHLFAFDLDGRGTMEDVYRYKLDTADDGIVFAVGDPLADPAAGWVECELPLEELPKFSIVLENLPPGDERTLTVTAQDEGESLAFYEYTWQVRPALGPVLLVMDASPTTDALYVEYMDETFGVDQWSRFEMVGNYPSEDWILRDTFRQFEVVMWYTGGSASGNLAAAVDPLPAGDVVPLEDYLDPHDGAAAGRLLMISKSVAGPAYTGGLSPGFVTGTLGISYTPDPVQEFGVDSGMQALGAEDWLPNFTSTTEWAKAIGVTPMADAGVLYQLEYCRCYHSRPSFEPYIGVRNPARRASSLLARTVVITTQLERYRSDEVKAMLSAVLENELGVVLP